MNQTKLEEKKNQISPPPQEKEKTNQKSINIDLEHLSTIIAKYLINNDVFCMHNLKIKNQYGVVFSDMRIDKTTTMVPIEDTKEDKIQDNKVNDGDTKGESKDDKNSDKKEQNPTKRRKTNQNSIRLVEKISYKAIVIAQGSYENGETIDLECHSEHSIISVSRESNDLIDVLNHVLTDVHQWKKCENELLNGSECRTVGKSMIINQKCTKCVLQEHIIQTALDDNKFNCMICSSTFFNDRKVTQVCCRQVICKNCQSKTKNTKRCPCCNKPGNDVNQSNGLDPIQNTVHFDDIDSDDDEDDE